MIIRRYHSGEEQELWNLFHDTIHKINIEDYTKKQVSVWAPETKDSVRWQRRITAMNPFVCVINKQIAGYVGLLETGYVDHFYVHHRFQRQGVGTSLMKKITQHAQNLSLTELTSDVSITARPFFESCGFVVVKPQEVYIGEVCFKNYKMLKPVNSADS